MRRWEMHAGSYPDHPAGPMFMHFGDPRYVKMYGVEPVEIEVIEDPDGRYYGWIDADRPDVPFSASYTGEPVMIQPDGSLFRMQFPYGPQAEVDAGKGEVVRLSVKQRGA